LPGTTCTIDATGSAPPSLAIHSTVADLPAAARRLFADPADDLFASRLWFDTLIAHGQPADHVPRLALCSAGDVPFALVPLASRADGTDLQSLTGPYTLTFRPLLAPELARDAAATAAGLLIGGFCRQAALTRLDALAGDTPGLGTFVIGLRRAGLVVQRFDHFGNWHEPVADLSFADYLATRPGALRSTIRRKMRRAEPGSDFALVAGTPGLAEGIAAFEEVYARSWKEPEPFAAFNPALMRATAAAGLLRLGILRLSGQAAAVQFWIVSGGRAILLKLAHDEAFAAFSPGTVLTALMIERLLGSERIVELDFGRGDDPYKRDWCGHRRQRVGLVLANPWRRRGMAAIGASLLGRARRRLMATRGATLGLARNRQP
jgi:Acetyltransferase (GNAT) domain